MSPSDNRSYDSGGDSDIEEIAIILPPKTGNNVGGSSRRSSPVPKRRKSSPQMDPIPTYTPTPLHILEQRSRGIRGASTAASDYSYPTNQIVYDPLPISNQDESNLSDSPPPSNRSNDNEYTPLLHPSPHVIGCNSSPPPANDSGRSSRLVTNSTTATHRRPPSSHAAPPSTNRRQNSITSTTTATRKNTPRPVSSALAQAVSRRRNSLVQQEKNMTAPLSGSDAAKSVSALIHNSVSYVEEPVIWSPKVPAEIAPVRSDDDIGDDESGARLGSDEDYSKYQSLNVPKARVAHKPTIPKNKQNRPRVPVGVSKKVPQAFRVKYLDVIINEYLNTGHDENESYQEALKEEQALANRAANKNIYVNLVAGLKKKIREKAGISTLQQDEDPKYVNGNKVVSHEDILTGKVVGTFSIQRKRKLSDPSELNEYELYDRLSRYVMSPSELGPYGYPCRDPDNPELRLAPPGKDGVKQQLRAKHASSYTCERCAKVYRVDEDGLPLTITSKCIFHPGHLWNERINRALEKRYSCCKGDASAGGCSSNQYHVHRGELELENYLHYVETQPKPERDPNKHGIYALDCEMCYTTCGLELTRVTVINYKFDVVYEKLVKPKNPVLDYNTKFSGIKPGDLDTITTTLGDVQRDLLEMFSDKTILIGHSLDSDMRALKLYHKHFIDTAQLFPHKRGLPFKRALRTLMVENLRLIIQEDAGHDSKEDACAAFRLVMWKAKTDVPKKVS